jgi:molybdopterin adenylyltransferase
VKPLFKAAVVTVSDKGASGLREDKSGAVVREMLEGAHVDVVRSEIVPDDRNALEILLRDLCDVGLNLVVTTGGTGLSPRDVTPEATMAVIDREVPGMAEAMRAQSLKVTAHAMISRAVCGLRGATLVVNLPGSPAGARECLEVILPALPHALEVASGNASECAAEPPAD